MSSQPAIPVNPDAARPRFDHALATLQARDFSIRLPYQRDSRRCL
jgi:hypothetical protein